MLRFLLFLLMCHSVSHAVTPAQVRQAELHWYKASGVILSLRRAAGNWDVGHDPALTGLIGGEEGPWTTTLGDLNAKQTAAQSGWCRAIACLLDSVGITERDTVGVTMSGSFPGINLAVLLTLEAAHIPYRSVASLGASSYGANLEGFSWPAIESILRERGILEQGSVCITPGGTSDRCSGFFLEDRMHVDDELRKYPGSYQPVHLRQAVQLRRHVLGELGTLSLYINVGGGHAAVGSNGFGRRARGGLLGENEWLLLDALKGEDEGTRGLLEYYFSHGMPVLHFLDIVRLAQSWGLPTPPQEARTPADLVVDCHGQLPQPDEDAEDLIQ